MKFSLQLLAIGTVGAAALCLSPLAVSPARAITTGEITLGPERVQIVHTTGDSTDFTNFNITFTNSGDYPYFDCDNGEDDPIASGIEVAFAQQGCPSECEVSATCVDSPLLPIFPFDVDIEPFVSRTVNNTNYGTFYAVDGSETVSARIVRLSTPPPGEGCGTWEMNVEATGLDLSTITKNPMSIWLRDEDFSGPFEGFFCFDIDNAIIGGPIPKKPAPVHRRNRR